MSKFRDECGHIAEKVANLLNVREPFVEKTDSVEEPVNLEKAYFG